MNVLPAKKSTLVIWPLLSEALAVIVIEAGAVNEAPSAGEVMLTNGPPPFWANATVEKINRANSKYFIVHLQNRRIAGLEETRPKTGNLPSAARSLAPQ